MLAGLLLLALLPPGVVLRAEETQERSSERPMTERIKSVYRISVILRKLQASERVGQKKYELLLEHGETGKLRILNNAQFLLPNGTSSGIETGLKCDARYEERGGLVYIDMELHVSNLANSKERSANPPAVDSLQCRVETVLSPGVPTVVARFDGEDEGQSYEIEVNAEKAR